ncbi:hypothetical protein NTE31_000282 [Vibrio cholerae]
MPFLLAGLFGFGFGDLWLAIMVQLLVVSQAETTLKQDNQTEALKDEALFVPKYRTDWFKCLYPSYLESATPSSVGTFDAVANVSRGGKSFALRVWCSRQNK